MTSRNYETLIGCEKNNQKQQNSMLQILIFSLGHPLGRFSGIQSRTIFRKP